MIEGQHTAQYGYRLLRPTRTALPANQLLCVKEMKKPRDVEAEIYFLTTEEGGRKGPAYSNYRPQFYYDGQDWDAPHEYPDVKQVNPGDTVRTYLAFLSPQEHVGKLHVGKEFLIREGIKTVGRGTITKILELEVSAKRHTASNT